MVSEIENFSRLRLGLYKGLGFTPIVNSNGEVEKMFVRKYHCHLAIWHD